MSDHTPREIVNDYLEERGRLYWEKVGELVDSFMDSRERELMLSPDVLALMRDACRAYGREAFKEPFEAFVAIHSSKNPNGGVRKSFRRHFAHVEEIFPENGSFPFTSFAVNALYHDCFMMVKDRLRTQTALPEG